MTLGSHFMTLLLLPRQAKLELYGLYRQATEGSCTTARPAIWNLRARAKWCVRCGGQLTGFEFE